jgi:hypothetical protein
MNLKKQNNEAVEEIISLINKGVECWQKAGQLIAKNMDENPDFVDQICDQCKDISLETIYRFEQIGRQQLYPNLLLNDSPGVRRLRRLPYNLQKKYANEPVTLLISGGETLETDVRNLTPNQAAQVFSGNRLRTISEQRAYIEDKKSSEEAVPASGNLPYRIVGKTVVVMQSCKFTPGDLARLLFQVAN